MKKSNFSKIYHTHEYVLCPVWITTRKNRNAWLEIEETPRMEATLAFTEIWEP